MNSKVNPFVGLNLYPQKCNFDLNHSICPKWAQSWIQPNSALAHLLPSLSESTWISEHSCAEDQRQIPWGSCGPPSVAHGTEKMSRFCSCCTSFTGELSCFKFWQSTQMGLDPKASKMENKEVPATHCNHISFVEWVYIAPIYLHISFACIIILYMLLLYICYMYIVYSVLYNAVKCVRCTDILKYNFWNVHVHLNYSYKSTHKICFLIGLPPMNPVVLGAWGKPRSAALRWRSCNVVRRCDCCCTLMPGYGSFKADEPVAAMQRLAVVRLWVVFFFMEVVKIRKDQLKDWVVWFLSEIQRDEEKLTEFVSFGCWSFWRLWRTIPPAIMEVEHEGKDYVLPK